MNVKKNLILLGVVCFIMSGCAVWPTRQKGQSIDSGFSSTRSFETWPQLKDTVSSLSNPPPFVGKVMVKDVKIPIPEGFSTMPFNYHDTWFESQFPNQGFPFSVIFNNGHYAAIFASSSREFVLEHDGKVVYRGLDHISGMKLVDGGNRVTFMTSSVATAPSVEEDKKRYVAAGGWGSTPVNREEYLRPIAQCPETKKELERFRLAACSDVILLGESRNCTTRSVLVRYTPYKNSWRGGVVNNPCNVPHAVEYWLNGELVSSLPFPVNATAPIDYASLLFLNEKNGFGMSQNGLHFVINPIFRRIQVGNSGAWIALFGPFYVVNGVQLPFDERLGVGAVQVYINNEGTAYVVEGARGFLTSDDQFFSKNTNEFRGPSAKIEIVSSTVYHYYFDSKE